MTTVSRKKVVAIVEARMTSRRLPGKHLLPVQGKPILGYLLHRLKQVSSLDQIVVAMTDRDTDDSLQVFVEGQGVTVFRGSEDDVMGRVLHAAQANSADVICEVTGDCPIIDPDLVRQIVDTFLANNVAYVNNGRGGLPGGMTAQVFATDALAMSESLTRELLDREHVTLHIKRHPELFSAIYMVPLAPLVRRDIALTLDDERDYELLCKIIAHFGDANPMFRCADVIKLLDSHPEWMSINQAVIRKGAN
jgi:spore coat polysaccharide biosynthesis protein SpsF